MQGGTGNDRCRYLAPLAFVWVFYSLLAAWTGVSLFFMWAKAATGMVPAVQLFMIGFVLAYTWYFSLGISYEVRADEHDVEMRSFRRTLRIRPEDISAIEGPRFALLTFGFLRFRLAREKAYVFCYGGSSELKRLISIIKQANVGVRLKSVNRLNDHTRGM